MKSIDRRVSKLENRFVIAQTKTTYVVVLMDAGSNLGTAQGTSRDFKKPDCFMLARLAWSILAHPGWIEYGGDKEVRAREGEGSRSTPRPMHPVFNVLLDRV